MSESIKSQSGREDWGTLKRENAANSEGFDWSATHYGTVVVERLANHLLEGDGELPELRFRVHPARYPDEIGDFRALFEELEALSGGDP